MTPTEYAVALAIATGPIIAAVHAGRDPRPALRAALTIEPPPGVHRLDALVTVLAAQVDKLATLDQRLNWVRALDPQLREAS